MTKEETIKLFQDTIKKIRELTVYEMLDNEIRNEIYNLKDGLTDIGGVLSVIQKQKDIEIGVKRRRRT